MSDDWHNRPNAEDEYEDYLDANNLMVCEDCGDKRPQDESCDSCDDCQEQRAIESEMETCQQD